MPSASRLKGCSVLAREKVIAEFDYAHPVFDASAISAQRRLGMINGRHGVWFCGAWNGYGFHEDGLKSALRVANAMDCHAPWQDAAAASSERPARPALSEYAA